MKRCERFKRERSKIETGKAIPPLLRAAGIQLFTALHTAMQVALGIGQGFQKLPFSVDHVVIFFIIEDRLIVVQRNNAAAMRYGRSSAPS